ncbi:hypothetical protein BN1708_001506, partial [Verticillium longisporum]
MQGINLPKAATVPKLNASEPTLSQTLYLKDPRLLCDSS